MQHKRKMYTLKEVVDQTKQDGKATFLTFQNDVAASGLFHGDDAGPLKADKNEALMRLTERHYPDVLVPTATWTKPQARCRVFQGVRRDVKTICPSCPSKFGRCSVPCFKLWHTQLHFWEYFFGHSRR